MSKKLRKEMVTHDAYVRASFSLRRDVPLCTKLCEIITGGACGCAFLKPSACRRFDSDDSVKVSTFAGLRYKGLQGVIK